MNTADTPRSPAEASGATPLRGSAPSPVVFGSELVDLDMFFEPHVQLATAPLPLAADIAAHFEGARPGWEWRQIVPVLGGHQPDLVRLRSLEASAAAGGASLRAAVGEVLEVMALLFGADALGVRVVDATRPTCPRFHVDRVLARGVLTLVGRGSQYLLDHEVDRAKLGHGGAGQPDEVSGLILEGAQPRALEAGRVCLFKGEDWPSNEGKGLIHRSPPEDGASRWLLTVDLL